MQVGRRFRIESIVDSSPSFSAKLVSNFEKDNNASTLISKKVNGKESNEFPIAVARIRNGTFGPTESIFILTSQKNSSLNHKM